MGTLCSFKVGADDAEYLAKEYAPLLTEQDVLGIANYRMYTKLNINNATSRPFSVSTIWDTSKQNHKVAKIIREYARIKHGRKKDFVEQEITTRIGIDFDAPAVDTSKLPGQAGKEEAGPGGAEDNPMVDVLKNAMEKSKKEEEAKAETEAEAEAKTENEDKTEEEAQ